MNEQSSYSAADVTLYVPCYQAGATVGACVRAILEQSVKPRCLLLVDDGSQPALESCLESGLRDHVQILLHPHNQGLAVARNTAMAACWTALIAALDADVRPCRNWLRALLDALNAHGAAGVGGRMDEAYSTSLADCWRAVHMAQHWGDQPVVNPRFLYGANTLFVTDILRTLNGYDTRLHTNYEDVTLTDRLYALGHTLVYTPAARCLHGRHDTVRTILPGFWRWYVDLGRLRGDFDGPDGLIQRIAKVNFGIFRYRWDQDEQAGRRELLPLDLLLPWVFCLLDLRLYRQGLADDQGAIETMPVILPPIEKHLGHAQGTGNRGEGVECVAAYLTELSRSIPAWSSSLPWMEAYRQEFTTCLESWGWCAAAASIHDPGLFREWKDS